MDTLDSLLASTDNVLEIVFKVGSRAHLSDLDTEQEDKDDALYLLTFDMFVPQVQP